MIKAFPSVISIHNGRQEYPGMELRDYFAAHAMSSMIELMFKAKPSDEVIDSAMASCYRIADAMIKAREKTNE